MPNTSDFLLNDPDLGEVVLRLLEAQNDLNVIRCDLQRLLSKTTDALLSTQAATRALDDFAARPQKDEPR